MGMGARQAAAVEMPVTLAASADTGTGQGLQRSSSSRPPASGCVTSATCVMRLVWPSHH